MSSATETEKPEEVVELEPAGDDASVYERMLLVIRELPAIGKTRRNVQQDFMFRGYDDVLNALNPLLGKHGVFFVPTVLERIPGERTARSGSTMYEVNLHLSVTFYGRKGDSFTASGWGEGTDHGDKATSKAMTMGLKYVLFQAFAISTEEAYDPDAGKAEETTRDRGDDRQPRQGEQRGGGTHGRRQTPQEKRAPKSWDEMGERLSHGFDSGAPADFSAFVKDLAMHQYGVDIGDVFGKIGPGSLKSDDWKALFLEVAKVLDRLFEIVPPGGAMPPTLEQIRQAFVDVSKVELAGPASSAERAEQPTEPTQDEVVVDEAEHAERMQDPSSEPAPGS